jgi:hypothetical protein
MLRFRCLEATVLSDTTTIYVYTWGFILYLMLVFVALGYMAWIGYKVGTKKGFQEGREYERSLAAPTKFRQRAAQSDPSRVATQRRARVLARRQNTPEPRRGFPPE